MTFKPVSIARLMLAVLVSVVVLACGNEPPSVACAIDTAIETERTQTSALVETLEGDLAVHCNNDVVVGEGDGDGSGGAGGAGGAGGSAAEERFGPYTCYAYPTWTGAGLPCDVDEDCPPAESPCVIPICGAGKTCTTAPVKIGAKLCGSEYFSCAVTQCCGAWPLDEASK